MINLNLRLVVVVVVLFLVPTFRVHQFLPVIRNAHRVLGHFLTRISVNMHESHDFGRTLKVCTTM